MAQESKSKSGNSFDSFSWNSAVIQQKAKAPNIVSFSSFQFYSLVDNKMWEDFQNIQKLLATTPE